MHFVLCVAYFFQFHNILKNGVIMEELCIKHIYGIDYIPKRCTAISDSDITLEMAEKCQKIVAELVVSDGSKYLPLFERVNHELESLKKQHTLITFAHQVAS